MVWRSGAGVCGPVAGSAEGRKAIQKNRPKWGGGFVLGLCVLLGVLSAAEAAIKIETAQVQNGVAFIKGNGAVLGAQITWEEGLVTTANTKNGGFSFFGVLPEDCQGTLSDGSATVSVNVLNCTPDSDGAPAPVAVTGQTLSFATGDDGALAKGVPFPSPRFTDNGDGTVTDNLTGLIWLKDASCLGSHRWEDSGPVFPALDRVAVLNAGTISSCANYAAGTFTDWRLPNVKELLSLIDFGFSNPALPNAAGTAKWTEGNAFSGVQSAGYWSSTTNAGNSAGAWLVDLNDGSANVGAKESDLLVWPVRGGAE
jgi:hypothetical protein